MCRDHVVGVYFAEAEPRGVETGSVRADRGADVNGELQ